MVEAFDELLKAIGTGKWNYVMFFTCGYWMNVVVYHVLAAAFLAPAVEYSCIVPPEDQPYLTSQVFDANGTKIDQCHYTSNITKECQEWYYDNTTYGHTMTAEFNLVCNKSYLRSIYQSLYMFGSLVAAPIGGMLADKYGRKLILTIGSVSYFILSIIACWVPSMSLILTFRFLMGMLHTPTMDAGFILGMEECTPSVRSAAGVLLAMPWGIGTIIWGVVAYFIRDWRWLQFAISLPTALLFPGLWYIDESPRWLAVRGRHDEAIRILRKAARLNGTTLPPEEEIWTIMKQTQKANSTTGEDSHFVGTYLQLVWVKTKGVVRQFFILLRTPKLRHITLATWVSFLLSSAAFFGLTLNAVNFSVDPYIYMICNGLVEIPAYLIPPPIIARFGRKIPLIIGFSITSISLLALPFIDKDESWLVITIAMIGRLSLSAAFQTFFLYSTELLPTEVRTQGFGTGILLSRLGGVIAPFITDLLGHLYSWSPSVMFGVFSAITSFILLLLPETLNRPMPDTIAELESSSPSGVKNRYPDGVTIGLEQRK